MLHYTPPKKNNLSFMHVHILTMSAIIFPQNAHTHTHNGINASRVKLGYEHTVTLGSLFYPDFGSDVL